MVNQWQLLALSQRKDICVRVRDTAFPDQNWHAQEQLFEPDAQKILKSLKTAPTTEPADVTLRIFFPFDFAPSRSAKTAIFATLENQTICKDQLTSLQAFEELQRAPPAPNVEVVTPSHWSAEGFYKSGFRREQIHIIPHGVDVRTFHPMAHIRQQVRQEFSISADEFVFLSVGAITGNKGIDLLLRAFSQVNKVFPNTRLVLKGMDTLYDSRNFLSKNMSFVPRSDQARVTEKLIYIGSSFSNQQLAQLYQIADSYVAPYRAEGFNLPVLEAAACGLPIICTGGGSTDDFVTSEFARKIESKIVPVEARGQGAVRLEPDLDHLVFLMGSAVEDRAWYTRAASTGPPHVSANYTWDRVVDMLVQKLLN